VSETAVSTEANDVREASVQGLPVQKRLIFLIGPPRSGSTLLMRILNATSAIYSRPEPHLMTPLAHLGFYDNVESASYDHLQAQQAVQAYVQDLPGGEKDYLDALRAYTDVMYGRMLQNASDERYFLDKTPAYGLIVDFLAKLYPEAKFIVLTRHPAAIFASFANSFFDGDYEAAVRFNPVISRYVPKMAWFLRERPVDLLHVCYEDVASKPEETLQRISEYLEIPFEPDAVNYKRKDVAGEGLGDPIGVQQHNRPVTSSIHKWAKELAADEDKLRIIADQLATLSDEDLATWGYPRETLWAPLQDAEPKAVSKAKKRKWDNWASQRRILVWVRKDIETSRVGKLLRKLRFICDVLLRGGFASYTPTPPADSPAGRGTPEDAFPDN